MANVRELEPVVVRAFSRSGDDLGLARLPWSNVEIDDALEIDDGRIVYIVDVVTPAPGSPVAALVKISPLQR